MSNRMDDPPGTMAHDLRLVRDAAQPIIDHFRRPLEAMTKWLTRQIGRIAG